jgi:hypothetical protein
MIARMLRLLLPLTVAIGCAARAPSPQATGCTTAERTAMLRAMQDDVLARAPRRLASLDAALGAGGPLAGWRLSHGYVVLAGTGGVAVDDIRAVPPMPHLLLYAPSPASAPDEWLDFDRGEGPYALIGWAYIAPFAPGSSPPVKPCIAAGEWLVHEAGWHMMDGGMALTPGATVEPARPAQPVHFWHPRAWDLHVWLGADGVPTVAFENPTARDGGLALPDGAFLRLVDGRFVPASG